MFDPQEPLFEIRLSSLEVIISSFVVREEPPDWGFSNLLFEEVFLIQKEDLKAVWN
jgi:hypothetical protein